MAATFGPRLFRWRRSQEARLESYFRRDREGPRLSHQGWQSSIQRFRSSEAAGLMRCRRNVAMVVLRPKLLLRTRSRICAVSILGDFVRAGRACFKDRPLLIYRGICRLRLSPIESKLIALEIS